MLVVLGVSPRHKKPQEQERTHTKTGLQGPTDTTTANKGGGARRGPASHHESSPFVERRTNITKKKILFSCTYIITNRHNINSVPFPTVSTRQPRFFFFFALFCFLSYRKTKQNTHTSPLLFSVPAAVPARCTLNHQYLPHIPPTAYSADNRASTYSQKYSVPNPNRQHHIQRTHNMPHVLSQAIQCLGNSGC